ncbi:flagellar biosynthesis protein FlhA [bacterium]|nr:flagellar biosynthesis protein FlhA [bacterium]
MEGMKLGRILKYSDLSLAVGIILIVIMMMVPLPPFLLDVLLTLNISFSLSLLLISIYVKEAIEISTFPSILLFATLFRVALSISATRLILLNGYAGEVINAFGRFVVGGNYIVGLVIFLILVIIQFVVITNGAQRVAEVAARFTLDAMPGKQMSIDADLNAGLITEEEARNRRRQIEQEADFYGAMDGASKFVRGDAIAAIIITAVNFLGGWMIGVLQRGMDFRGALEAYALLTVGNGLVNQISALLVSTATGLIVTRGASEENLGIDFSRQVLSNSRVMGIIAGVLFLLGLVPGLPKLVLFLFAILMGGLSYILKRIPVREEIKEEKPSPIQSVETVMPLVSVDPMELEIGYGLIPIVDKTQGGELSDRITILRKQIAQELGIIVPPIRIRDNIQLRPNSYIIKVRGIEVAKGEVLPGYVMVLNPEGLNIEGIEFKEPIFGLPARWIPMEARRLAESKGYTVIDCSGVIATHLTEIIKRYADELLTRQDVQRLLDVIRQDYPSVVDDALSQLSLGEIQRLLQVLLRERVPLRDLVSILETASDTARVTKDLEIIVQRVRERLGRMISRELATPEGVLPVILIEPKTEEKLVSNLFKTDQGTVLSIDPNSWQKLIGKLSSFIDEGAKRGFQPVIVTSSQLRLPLKKLLDRAIPQISVLSYNEIDNTLSVENIGVISL